MERKANYALVGAVTIALLIAAMIFLIWLGGLSAGKTDEYRIVFKGPVKGISDGTDVQFNGIKMGSITDINLDARDPNRVIADISLKHGTPIRADSVASTESQGITGVNIVQITAGNVGLPLLRDTTTDRRPVIRSKHNPMDSLLQGGGELLGKAGDALDRVNRVFSDTNIRNLSDTIADIRTTSGELRARRGMFAKGEQALTRLDAAASDIQGAAASARAAIDTDGRSAFRDVASAAKDLRGAIADARVVISKVNMAAGDPSRPDAATLSSALESIRGAADSLDRLTRQIQRDPRSLIGKRAGAEREIKQ